MHRFTSFSACPHVCTCRAIFDLSLRKYFRLFISLEQTKVTAFSMTFVKIKKAVEKYLHDSI